MKEDRVGRKGGGNIPKCYWFVVDHETEKTGVASIKFALKLSL